MHTLHVYQKIENVGLENINTFSDFSRAFSNFLLSSGNCPPYRDDKSHNSD